MVWDEEFRGPRVSGEGPCIPAKRPSGSLPTKDRHPPWQYMHIHTYIHTYVHTYVHHACMHAHIHTDTHSFIHSFIHSYKHTYIHTYIHTHSHEDVSKTCLCIFVGMCVCVCTFRLCYGSTRLGHFSKSGWGWGALVSKRGARHVSGLPPRRDLAVPARKSPKRADFRWIVPTFVGAPSSRTRSHATHSSSFHGRT